MCKRMTWNEIKTAYPNKWVGLSQVVWEDSDGGGVVSAVVKYVEDNPDKLYDMQISGQDIYTTYTTPETFPYGQIPTFWLSDTA